MGRNSRPRNVSAATAIQTNKTIQVSGAGGKRPTIQRADRPEPLGCSYGCSVS